METTTATHDERDDVAGHMEAIRVINSVNWQKVYDALAPKIDWNKAFEGVTVYYPNK